RGFGIGIHHLLSLRTVGDSVGVELAFQILRDDCGPHSLFSWGHGHLLPSAPYSFVVQHNLKLVCGGSPDLEYGLCLCERCAQIIALVMKRLVELPAVKGPP